MSNLFDSIRFKDDNFALIDSALLLSENAVKDNDIRLFHLANSLKVSKSITPIIYDIVSDTLSTLNSMHEYEIFVYADHNLQASCITLNNKLDFIVLLSSSLIEKLTPKELSFVIGHEFGHFYFQHFRYGDPYNNNHNEFQKLSMLHYIRSAELSADRIGLIACSDINSAFSAMLKISSGLSNNFLRPNIVSYIDQSRYISNCGGIQEVAYQTHPLMPIRAKALFRFSQTDVYFTYANKTASHAPLQLSQIDKSIKNDLDKISGGFFNSIADDLINESIPWICLSIFLHDKRLTKAEQLVMKELLGASTTSALLDYFANRNINAVKNKEDEKITLLRSMPSELKHKAITLIDKLIESSSSNHESTKYLKSYYRSRIS